MNRRSFLKQTGAAASVTAAHTLKGATQGVSLIVDPKDPVASAPPPAWAVRELKAALANQGLTARVYPRLDAAPAGDRYIVIAGGNSGAAREILQGGGSSMPYSNWPIA